MSATNYLDPHKHPLYRPHMGDMTGWRFLELGEVLEPLDEFYKEKTKQWRTTASQGDTVQDWMDTYRRRVTPEDAKPTNQKRFVTVVYEVKSGEPFPDDALRFGERQFIEIREGNALAALDRIEDNMVEAVRKAVREGKV